MSSENPQSIRVQCPQCAKPLKLDRSLLGKQIKCPSCDRVFATRAKPAGQQPKPAPLVPTQTASPAATPKAAVPKAAVQKVLSLSPVKATPRKSPPPHPFDFPAVGAVVGNASVSQTRPIPNHPTRPPGVSQAGPFVNRYWLQTIVLLLAVVTLVASWIAPWPFLIVGVVEIVLGAIVVGLLFVPRFYVMRRMFGAMGTVGDLLLRSAATIGTGGVVIIVILAIVKAMRRTGSANLDFSGITGQGVIMFLLAPLSLAAVIALWYFIGLMRTIASGYLLQCSLMLVVLVVGAIQNPRMNRGGAMPPTDPAFRAPPRMEGGPLPRPGSSPNLGVVETRNPLGYPSSEVIHFIVNTNGISDIEHVRTRLTQGAPPNFWQASQAGSQLDLWLYQSAPVEQVARRVTGDRTLAVESIDPATRTIRLRGQ